MAEVTRRFVIGGLAATLVAGTGVVTEADARTKRGRRRTPPPETIGVDSLIYASGAFIGGRAAHLDGGRMVIISDKAYKAEEIDGLAESLLAANQENGVRIGRRGRVYRGATDKVREDFACALLSLHERKTREDDREISRKNARRLYTEAGIQQVANVGAGALKQKPYASVAKMQSCIAALRACSEGIIGLSDPIIMLDKAKWMDGAKLSAVRVGETCTVRECIGDTLEHSECDKTQMLAEHLGQNLREKIPEYADMSRVYAALRDEFGMNIGSRTERMANHWAGMLYINRDGKERGMQQTRLGHAHGMRADRVYTDVQYQERGRGKRRRVEKIFTRMPMSLDNKSCALDQVLLMKGTSAEEYAKLNEIRQEARNKRKGYVRYTGIISTASAESQASGIPIYKTGWHNLARRTVVGGVLLGSNHVTVAEAASSAAAGSTADGDEIVVTASVVKKVAACIFDAPSNDSRADAFKAAFGAELKSLNVSESLSPELALSEEELKPLEEAEGVAAPNPIAVLMNGSSTVVPWPTPSTP